jgi:hypothetical protein
MINNSCGLDCYIKNLNDSIQKDPSKFETLQLQEWQGKCKPKIVYEYETESKIKRINQILFSALIFPIGLGRLVHGLVGKLIFCGWVMSPKAQRKFFLIKALMGQSENCQRMWMGEQDNTYLANNRQKLIAKRIHVLVNGQKVDALIYGRRDTINNGVWTLVAQGAGCCMEAINEYQFEKNDTLKSNYLFFNYPGVGASSGLPSKKQVVNTYIAMLKFLEDQSKGIGAKKIICWGRSIGAAVQGEALKNHTLQTSIKYVSVKDRTFSRLTEVSWYTKILKFLGWEFDCVADSEELEKKGIQEIILQSKQSSSNFLTKDGIGGDGFLSKTNTLAYSLLEKQSTWRHKKFIGLNLSFGHYGLPPLSYAGIGDLINRI